MLLLELLLPKDVYLIGGIAYHFGMQKTMNIDIIIHLLVGLVIKWATF